jgi:eukaryotic-like serine/threonine-protein kinase
VIQLVFRGNARNAHDAACLDASAATIVPCVGHSDDITQTATASAPPVEHQPVEHIATASLQVRSRVRYEIIGEHGRGGLGRVSRARDRELGRDIAIKELIEGGHLHEVRFLREALITARLEHPGIVPVHEAGRWEDGTPFYAMKLVSGRPLKDLIARSKTPEERLALLPHLIAVADATAYAHGQRIVHRDLKPSNVIVGDFGETVVIDWGLAKDLSASDELPTETDSQRSPVLCELTNVGTVIGTPAYMAPEQARGEPIDQRVDVYAIGAMLWELCAGTRVPPSDARQLRGMRIDKDLAAILTKALAARPGDRYPDASALASDLKAFQAGARIAARDYSLIARLVHYTRQHRAFARSALAVALIALIGAIAFVRNIAVERDRADASAVEAREQQRRAEHTANELALKHAELQLRSDPTAAMSILATYRGTDTLQHRRLRAEAIGRGVAGAVLQPHGERIWFLAAGASGAIVSVSDDRTIRVTRGAESRILASDVAIPATLSHAAGARKMAYRMAPSGIAVVSLSTYEITVIPASTPQSMDIAPDGSRLAALERDGSITIWSLVPSVAMLRRERVPDAYRLEFATPDRVIVSGPAALRAVVLDARQASASISLPSQISSVVGERVAVADDQGNIALLSSRLELLSRISACRKSAITVSVVPSTDLVAFTCEEATVGVARHDASAGTLEIVDTFSTRERPHTIRPDEQGRYIVIADDSNAVYVYDVEARIARRYDGHTAQVTFVTPPTPELDRILVGDARGAVRVWDPPPRGTRKLLQASNIVYGLAFSPDGRSLISSSLDNIIRRIQIDNGAVTEYRGHGSAPVHAAFMRDGRSLLSYGGEGSVRIWNVGESTPVRVLAGHRGAVTGARYIESCQCVVSSARDGQLLMWPPEATEAISLHKGPEPLTALEILSHSDHAIVQDAAGAIWDASPAGAARKVRHADAASVTAIRASADGRLFAIGTDQGIVTIHDTTDWRTIASAKLDGRIRLVRFDPRARDLIAISEQGHVRILALGPARTLAWNNVSMPARSVAYSPNGEVLAFVCSDGASWLYDIRRDLWVHTLDHASETSWLAFSPDGALLASSDRRGSVIVRDVAATFATAAR